jgi:hypothetical protein
MTKCIFLSCVTSEFGDVRTQLAGLIANGNSWKIRHQDNFLQRDTETDILKKLFDEISASEIVFHIIGDQSGWKIPIEHVNRFLNQYPTITSQFPKISVKMRSGALSATQWEFWIARFLRKHLYCFSCNGTACEPEQSAHAHLLEDLRNNGYFDLPHFSTQIALFVRLAELLGSLGVFQTNQLPNLQSRLTFQSPFSQLQIQRTCLPPSFCFYYSSTVREAVTSNNITDPSQLLDQFKNGFDTLLNFSASLLLSIIGKDPNKILRSKAIKLQECFKRDTQLTLLQTSNDGMANIADLCLESLRRDDSDYSLLLQLGDKLREISAAISNLSSKSSLNGAVDAISAAVNQLSATWSHFDLIVPTKVEEIEGTKTIRINRWWRFESLSQQWQLQNDTLTISIATRGDKSSTPFHGILQNISILIAEKNAVDSSLKDPEGSVIDTSKILSLFPFAFAQMEQLTSEPELYFYHDFALEPRMQRSATYKTIESNSISIEKYDAQDKPLLIEAVTSFFNRLKNRIGRDYNLSIRPEAIASEHDYVLCDRVEGRNDEFEMMNDWIRNENSPNIFCWEAFGGDGKSAMVHDWLFLNSQTAKTLQELGYSGAIWASFYQPQFDLFEFARQSLIRMRGETRVEYDESAIIDAFIHAAEKEQFLFVLDGLERLLFTELEEETKIYKLILAGATMPQESRRFRRINIGDNRETQIDFRAENLLRRLADMPQGSSRFLLTSRFCPAALEELGEKARIEKLEQIKPDAAEIIWWKAAKRQPQNQREANLVRKEIERLGRHPLTIKIMAASVGQISFSDWKTTAPIDEDNRSPGLPLNDNNSDNQTDARNRCSEVIWICGLRLPSLHREFLRTLNRLSSGSVSLQLLKNEPQIIDLIGTAGNLNSISRDLNDKGWIGMSQGGLIDLHPMIRQFAKDRRHNLGLSKQAIKDSQEYDKLLTFVENLLNNPNPNLMVAWKRLIRGEPWNRAQTFDHTKTRTEGMRKLRRILLRFLPRKTTQSIALPFFDNRNDQAQFFFHLGSTEAYLGEYQQALTNLRTGLDICELHGFTNLAENCRNLIQWTAIYDGDLKAAQAAIKSSTFSPVLEVCYSLSGLQTDDFSSTDASEHAFPLVEDRSWLFQSCAEACFWKCKLEEGQKWLDLMNDEAGKRSNDANQLAINRSQIMWETWTNGVFICERVINAKNYTDGQYHKALEKLISAQKEAEASGYGIVTALAIAFQIRLLSFAIKFLPDDKTREEAYVQYHILYSNFITDQKLHCRFALCIVYLAQFTLLENVSDLRLAWETANELRIANGAKGRFYFGCFHINRILTANPSINLLNSTEDIVLPEKLETVETHGINTTAMHDVANNINTIRSIPKVSADDAWEVLKKHFGREIQLFIPLVHYYNGSADDFHKAICEVLDRSKKLDPIAAVTEMIARSVEDERTDFLSEDNFLQHINTLREEALVDFREQVPHALRFKNRLDMAVSKADTRFLQFIAAISKDSARILRLNEGDYSSTFEQWRHRVPNELIFQIQSSYGLLVPFFETLLDLHYCLREDEGQSLCHTLLPNLIENLRVPSKACYRASFYRLYYEQVLPSIIASACSEKVRDKLELWRFAYRCNWHNLDEGTKSRCLKIFKSTGHARTLKLLREMDRCGIDLGELVRCMDENSSENLQGNINWLKYLHRKDIEKKIIEKRKSLTDTFQPNKKHEMRQILEDLSKQLPFWENAK